MTKSITIYLEDSDINDYNLESACLINGKQYHDSLKQIYNILLNYDKGKKLTKEQVKILDDIRSKCAKHFRSVYHDSE